MSKLPRINTSRAPTPQSTKDTINTTALTTENYPSKSPLVYEAKLNQLETKLITLEQSNSILLNRISQIEASHDHNINQIRPMLLFFHILNQDFFLLLYSLFFYLVLEMTG